MNTKTLVTLGNSALAAVMLWGVTAGLGPRAAWSQEKSPFSISGTFVEGCSCSAPCACELLGLTHGCQGVGGMAFNSGSYKGVSLAGSKIVYATTPGEWVRLYVDVPNPGQRDAAEAFGKAVYSAFGPIEQVKPAHIDLSGEGGNYTLTVDGGNIMQLTTQPVLGGDNRTPIVISNIHDELHPTVMQGKTVSGSFHDGDRSFTLKDSNSYFTPKLKRSGKI